MRLRRSSSLMINDPYTLVVALDSKQEASGLLYMDDERTFNYKKGLYRRRLLAFTGSTLSSTASKESGMSKDFQPNNKVERVVVVGIATKPTSVVATDAQGKSTDLTFKYDMSSKTLTIRKPDLLMAQDWAIKLA